MKAASFSRFKPVLHKYQKVPDELVGDIRRALDKSQKSLERFKKNPTLENGVFLCEDDRWTMLLFYLARAGYNSSHEKLFLEFHKLEKDVRVEEQKLFDKLPDDGHEKRFVGHIIQSEQRRLHVLEAIKLGNMQEARMLMRKTIERAYHGEPKVSGTPLISFTIPNSFTTYYARKRPFFRQNPRKRRN